MKCNNMSRCYDNMYIKILILSSSYALNFMDKEILVFQNCS